MPEHTIPESLIDQIKAGRAVLVVGAGVGVPSWKQLLEKMNEQLALSGAKTDAEAEADADAEEEAEAEADAEEDEEGENEDEGADEVEDEDDADAGALAVDMAAAQKDLAKLLHKGNLAAAAGFLARRLGPEACATILAETWASPEPLPDVARAVARLPFRHVWTTFPGPVLEQAMAKEQREDWPEASVASLASTAGLSLRRRTLVKLLGDFDSYVMTPAALRQALAGAPELVDLLRDVYTRGTLVLVGFRHGDPDLATLLHRILARFDAPAQTHWFVASGLGPVAVDELASEHGMEVVALPGKGGDDVSMAALVEYLDALARACDKAGVDLAAAEPDADDLDGWLAVWNEDPAAARQAVERMAQRARDAGDSERLIDILVGRVEHEDTAAVRAGLLRELADVFENQANDAHRAFTALTAALREDPTDTTTVDQAERLAARTEGWAELVADLAEVANDMADAAIAASYWTRLGGWYMAHLDHAEYAIAAYRQAIKLHPAEAGAYTGLAELLRKQQRWAEVADVLGEHVQIEADRDRKVDLYLALGDLCETQLASTARAIEAYQASAELDHDNDDALAALERLYRRDERWDKLAEVLESRAARLNESDPQRAAALRRELATVRADKLGDLEGAIARYEAALNADEGDLEALRALAGLYEKVGNTDAYLGTLERLVEVLPQSDKPTVLLRLAAEVEDRDSDRAISCYESIIAMEESGPGAHNAYRALERLLGRSERYTELTAVYGRHIEVASEDEERIALLARLAEVNERDLDDPHRAIDALEQIRALDKEHRDTLGALARLYERIELWDGAVDALVAHAELEGDAGAAMWYRAGALVTAHLDALAEQDGQPGEDKEGKDWAALAETYLEKALALEPGHRDAMLALSRLYRAQSSWTKAVERLIQVEGATQNRLERIDFLVQAAQMAEHQLGDQARAIALLQRVLELDAEHVEAGQRVSEHLVAKERWQEAIPILEMLARNSEDKLERARTEATLGRAHQALDAYDSAVEHFRRAVQADEDDLDAARGLADSLYASAQELSNRGDGDDSAAARDARWTEVDERYRELVSRHRSALADSQVVEYWHRVGVAARVLDADDKAEKAFRRALELDPHHRSTLVALVDVARAQGDSATVIEAKRALMDRADDDARLDLLTDIGDLYHHELDDTAAALGAYLEALGIAPTSHVLLHKVLELHSARGEWRRAIDTLDTLAKHDTSALRRSKYHYTAAVIARDEIGDVDIAVQHFDRALDNAPDEKRAFEGLVALLEGRDDYKGLARAYRKMLQRLGDDAADDVLLALWSRLGELYAEHLDNREAAIAALEVAASLEPKNHERHEQLADLYLEAGADRRAEAIGELQILLGAYPDRVEIYRALSDLYSQAGDTDQAFCLARSLVFLGAANPAETELYGRYRGEHIAVAERRITEELWARSVVHPDEDRHLGAVFAALIGAIAATTAQPASAFDLGDEGRAETGRDARSVIGRVFKYVADILALDPEPHLYLRDDDEGIRILNTREGGKLVPSVLAGEPHASAKDDRALAFEVGRKLAYLQPERYIRYALAGPAELDSAVAAILAVTGSSAKEGEDKLGSGAAKLAAHLRETVPGAVLDRVSALARKLDRSVTAGAMVNRWLHTTELTANRVGFILCNDVEIAARLIATSAAGAPAASTKERLRDLLVYSVSESYFAVRRHLGLDIK